MSSKPTHPFKTGFSLIEIMVVIVIISIVLRFTVMATGDFGTNRQVRTAANDFVQTLRYAQHHAIIEGEALGVIVKDNTYALQRYNPSKKRWEPMPGGFGTKAHVLHRDVTLAVSSPKTASKHPVIVIDNTGDMTPFKVSFSPGYTVKSVGQQIQLEQDSNEKT